MMTGELDLGVIALGILVAWVTPVVLGMAAMATGAPGASMAPAYIIMGIGLALIALLAWWVDHPLQFFGGIALAVAGFVAFLAVVSLIEYMRDRRERASNKGSST